MNDDVVVVFVVVYELERSCCLFSAFVGFWQQKLLGKALLALCCQRNGRFNYYGQHLARLEFR